MYELTCTLLLTAFMQYPVVGVDGTDVNMWTRSVVVFARVDDVATSTHRRADLHLSLLATLAGRIDPAYQTEVTAGVEFAPGRSILREMPRKRSLVIAYLGKGEADETNTVQPLTQMNHFVVPNGPVTFMPDGLGLIEVTSFDDPKVTKTIENLRKLRGKQREDAERAKAEQKPAAGSTSAEKTNANQKSAAEKKQK